MASEAQHWAQKRNWNKRLVKGAYYQLEKVRRDLSTIPREEVDLITATAALDRVITRWESGNIHSKNQFIKGR